MTTDWEWPPQGPPAGVIQFGAQFSAGTAGKVALPFATAVLGTTAILNDPEALFVTPTPMIITRVSWSSASGTVLTEMALVIDGVVQTSFFLTGLAGVIILPNAPISLRVGQTIQLQFVAGAVPGFANFYLV